MNTKFHYFYRDANNYKSTSHSLVVFGELMPEEIEELNDSEGFIPQYLGLYPLQSELQEHDESDNRDEDGDYDPFGPEGADHPFHEWCGIGLTAEEPTDDRTAQEFLDQCRKGQACDWNSELYLDQLRMEAFESK